MSDDKDQKVIVLGDEKKILLDHDYDGIHELDNPLPNWWLAIFIGTHIFALAYAWYYHLGGPGVDQQTELARDMEQFKQADQSQTHADIAWDTVITDANLKAVGKVQYDAKCAVCHVADGGGSIGPNLADNFWIHGKGMPADLHTVIRDGVLEKGMPAWGPLLKDDEMKGLVAYVFAFKGTSPAKPKAPQGEEVKAQVEEK